jgi:hypothetical protein
VRCGRISTGVDPVHPGSGDIVFNDDGDRMEHHLGQAEVKPDARARMTDLAELIEAFAGRDGTGAFPHFERAEVAEGLRRRLADPVSLDQGAATFSGAAAFLYCLIGDAPELYLRYVIDLFEYGRAQLGSLAIEPSAGCRDAVPAAGLIAAVDWIALAGLRDSEGEIADWDAADDTGQPTTPPLALARWFAAAGYGQIRNQADRFFAKDPRELAQLRALQAQGRRLCLYISADMLVGRGDTARTLRPNQWVVLTAPVMLWQHGLAISVYQWGSRRRVPPFGELALDRFCRNFYGFVAAMPPAPPRSVC